MVFRFALILPALAISGVAGAAAAQATASAAVQATIRPGRCPAHAQCGKKPDKGAKDTPAQPAPHVVSFRLAPQPLGTGAPAGTTPLPPLLGTRGGAITVVIEY